MYVRTIVEERFLRGKYRDTRYLGQGKMGKVYQMKNIENKSCISKI